MVLKLSLVNRSNTAKGLIRNLAEFIKAFLSFENITNGKQAQRKSFLFGDILLTISCESMLL